MKIRINIMKIERFSIYLYCILLSVSFIPLLRINLGGFEVYPVFWTLPLLFSLFIFKNIFCRKKIKRNTLKVFIYIYIFIFYLFLVSYLTNSWSDILVKWIIAFVSIALIIMNLQDREHVHKAIIIAMVSISIICLYGLLMFLLNYTSSVNPFFRVGGNRNTLSLWVLGFLPVALSLGLDANSSKKNKTYMLSLFIIMFIAQFFTFNRSGILIMLLSIPLIIIMKKKWIKALFAFCSVIIIVMLFINIFIPVEQLNRLEDRINQISFIKPATRGDEFRISMIYRGLDLLAESPIYGVGFGAFFSGYTTRTTVSHNIYILTLAEQGLSGFLLLMAGLTAYITRLYLVYLKSKKTDSLLLGILIGSLALMLRGLFSDSVFFITAAWFLFSAGWVLAHQTNIVVK